MYTLANIIAKKFTNVLQDYCATILGFRQLIGLLQNYEYYYTIKATHWPIDYSDYILSYYTT